MNKNQSHPEVFKKLNLPAVIAASMTAGYLYSSLILSLPSASASTSSKMCTYALKYNMQYKFNCRWMINSNTKRTIFVDNNETGDRYLIEEGEFKVGPGKYCISKYQVTICTSERWF